MCCRKLLLSAAQRRPCSVRFCFGVRGRPVSRVHRASQASSQGRSREGERGARAHACAGASPGEVRAARKGAGVLPSFKRVDTCAAEFEAETPYMYSSYDGSCEAEPSSDKKARAHGRLGFDAHRVRCNRP